MAILFDLDGTLIDSAHDFLVICNKMRKLYGLNSELSYAELTPYITLGIEAMIAFGLNITREHPRMKQFVEEGLEFYEQLNYQNSRVFLGIEQALAIISEHNRTWGVVTNRSYKHASGVIKRLGWQQVACVVARDTTGYPKPHPMPLLHACKLISVQPCNAWYVGDDDIDIDAARNANIKAIAVLYGYGNISKSSKKYATHVAHSPQELLDLIKVIVA